jgi:PncC family amidohydrolase
MDIKKIREIQRIFRSGNMTLSAAESCTGGLISHYITAVPGASSYFRASVVAYSAEMKRDLLGIPARFIRKYGVVSEEVASEMAKRVRTLTGADVAVATTGNLGPDVLEEKPAGLVFIAVSTGSHTVARRLMLKGTRSGIKEKAVWEAFSLLLEVMSCDC